ncbi:MAG TPA: Ig-like domain-containing protein [Tepidisphaeraceae bacterium]|nr:Ig-like domain-containing protein [Tepidisphaeraceae bacterium]
MSPQSRRAAQPLYAMASPAAGVRRWRITHVVIGLLALAGGGFWLVQAMRHGAFVADPSGLTYVVASHPADGEKDVLPNIYVSANLNPGHSLDPETVDNNTVRLFRTIDQQLVPARVNTSAAGDNITLTPLEMLQPNTRYSFDVRGVKDSSGADVLTHTISFTTGAGAASNSYPVGFDKHDVPSDTNYYTALAVGPDHRLYAGTVDGKIIRRDIRPDGQLGPSRVIETVQRANDGPRLITGIAFDPKATADHLVLWISHGQFILNQHGKPSSVGATEWTGTISAVSGAELADYRDIVVGLPRSWRDHLNNQCVFGPDGALYWSQGSHTAMGAPDEKWGHGRPERLLSAAVLRLDPGKAPADKPIDARTPDGGGAYDPFAPDAPLTIYASGVRVGFDMIFHSNGSLYTGVNGSARGGNVPATPTDGNAPRRPDGKPYAGPPVLGLTVAEQDQPDLLLRLERGGYFGHPNPARGEYVLNGGNPTDKSDPLEVTAYPVGTRPDANWRPPAYSFGISASPNGMLEYKSDRRFFGGALDGKILVTRFSGGKDIMVLSLDERGNVAETITGIAGLTSFNEPLDLTQDPATGCVYVAEYAGGKLTLLRPITDVGRLASLKQTVFRQQVRPPTE